MKSLKNAALVMLMLGVVVSGFAISGCSHRKNTNSESVSLQDKNAAATIDRREARGRLTSTEAEMEKDSLGRDHLLQF